MKTDKTQSSKVNTNMRMSIVIAFLMLCFVFVVVRAFAIQVKGKEFYTKQGNMRQIKEIDLYVPRGTIFDRNGEPLAISTPMISVGIQPSVLIQQVSRLEQLAEALELDPKKLKNLVVDKKNKKFIYIKRRIPPYIADSIRALNIKGVEFRKEFKRYYPAGEIISQLIGFTDANDIGKEGIESTYDQWLSGTTGRKQVMQDRFGHIIKDIKEVTTAQAGKDIHLSIDRRLQYVAYKALKTAVYQHKAATGAVIILDITTGEVLAMVSQPSYNPNNKSGNFVAGTRNRAIQDIYEPGSVIKPFTVIAGMLSGDYDENSIIDTTPFEIDGFKFRDLRNYGNITLATLIGKSSNIGAAKIALSISKNHLWDTFKLFGLGSSTNSGIIGESTGYLQDYNLWSRSRHGNIAYGYGIQVTTLQLAAAYAAIANNGRWRSPTYIKGNINQDKAIIDPNIAKKVSEMLTQVVTEHNTGKRAMIAGYQVAGKTGTARLAAKGGYSDKYIASFVGYAPAMNSRLVVAVSITDPAGEAYQGGVVAAPVFKQVMQNSLRILNISPNKYQESTELNSTREATDES
ncbi:Cell division protein FtsI [Peptidoglycan synthetase] [hydrothermal vent metagenome]|uniref:Cell division protein FtsI [Peptidoglycan synthetase] n=1 Tax=hydrothermal vent metagenome TaxID=652676 RepID=A0A3B0VLB1_9ZZZZ